MEGPELVLRFGASLNVERDRDNVTGGLEVKIVSSIDIGSGKMKVVLGNEGGIIVAEGCGEGVGGLGEKIRGGSGVLSLLHRLEGYAVTSFESIGVSLLKWHRMLYFNNESVTLPGIKSSLNGRLHLNLVFTVVFFLFLRLLPPCSISRQQSQLILQLSTLKIPPGNCLTTSIHVDERKILTFVGLSVAIEILSLLRVSLIAIFY